MCALEEIDQPHLFKFKQSANVKRLVPRGARLGSPRRPVEAGRLEHDPTCHRNAPPSDQRHSRRNFQAQAGKAQCQPSRQNPATSLPGSDRYERSCEGMGIRRTRHQYPVPAESHRTVVPRPGRLRNGFDELKNQWGWGGYTTQDIEQCNLSAQAVALVYHWWSGYMRLANPKARLEAITSRPLLLAAVGRLTEHAG